MSLEGDAFPKKGGHVVVKVPVVQMKERGEEESTPLLVVPHVPCADADLVYLGPVPSKASSSDVRLEIGQQVAYNDAKRSRKDAIPARKRIHKLKCQQN